MKKSMINPQGVDISHLYRGGTSMFNTSIGRHSANADRNDIRDETPLGQRDKSK